MTTRFTSAFGTVVSTLILTLALMTGAAVHDAHAAAEVGEPAPAFTGTSAAGKVYSLKSLKGQYVVLEWTNHQCPYVQKHYGTGNMQKTQATFKERLGPENVTWFRIISSAPGKQGHVSPEKAKQIAQEQESNADATLLDESGEIGRAYEARTTPHMFIINPEGTLIYQGAIDNKATANWDDIGKATNYITLASNHLSKNMVPRPSVTRPYGCNVKYAD